MLYNDYIIEESGGTHILSICFYKTNLAESNADTLISALPFGKGEQERLRRIKNATKRHQSLSALLALERLVYCRNKKGDLHILRDDNGKPFFASLPLHFSLSHIDGLAVCALCDSPVGIDIEWLDSDKNLVEISRRFFLPEEQSQIESSNDPSVAFYSLWTKKEAYAKLTGEGLASIIASILASTLASDCKQYFLECGGRKAILSICADNTEDILIYDPEKEFKLYELQN